MIGTHGLAILLGGLLLVSGPAAPRAAPAADPVEASESSGAMIEEEAAAENEEAAGSGDLALFQEIDQQTGEGASASPATGNVLAAPASITIGPTEIVYTGEPIDLEFRDGDIRDLFRLIADASGLNIVLDPAVGGSSTLSLTNVPWDQALDLILKNHDLGKVWEGQVIRIAPLTKLAQEETFKRRLSQEKESAEPLMTLTKPLSYAKANEMIRIVQQFLSDRGDVIVDERTNTMIISDIGEKIDEVSALMNTLDTETPQVLIEARIVETTKNYSQELGVQWGLQSRADAAHGNTTRLYFPNNFHVGGYGTDVGPSGIPFVVNLPSSEIFGGIGLTFGNILDTFRLDLALTAMERDNRGKILSAPKVVTQNNRRALILSGEKVPFQIVIENTVSTQFENADLRLEVTPQITEVGTIIMEVVVDRSQIDRSFETRAGHPILKERVETTVLVEDGGTTVIGGIYELVDSTQEDQVPFFGDIPGIGKLFRHRKEQTTVGELLVFLTPRILRR